MLKDTAAHLDKEPVHKKGWLFIFIVLNIALIIAQWFCIPPLTVANSINMLNGIRIEIPLKSVKDLRDNSIIKQSVDYSCGAAALSTILTYSFGDEVDEDDILLFILLPLSKDEELLRKKQGISLLDLQNVATAYGYNADGYRITPEYLPKLQRPVIVFIKPQGYEHFAVLKGVKNDRAYLADPSLGNIRMPVYKFLDMWLDANGKGIIFVVERKDGQWTADSPLKPPAGGLTQPEILTVREMMETGNPYVRYPHLSR